MPTIRQLIREHPYSSLPSDETATVQGVISIADKRCIVGALADDGIHTFIIQHTYARIANYIRQHKITPYADASAHSALVDFIRNGSDSRASGSPAPHPHAGSTPRGQPTEPRAAGQSVSPRKVHPRRTGTASKTAQG